MVCHSHDDVGFQQTPEEYYATKVKDILSSVVDTLSKHRNRRYSQTEIYYFSKWWQDQNSTVKDTVKKLVKEGRLEFVLGGWVANDEACPTYTEIILNIMTGHAFLLREFGITPKIAWLLDSFGHSAATPELLGKMGFEALFFARADDEDKLYRQQNKMLEFVWEPVYEGPRGVEQSEKSLFTHITHENYQGGCEIDLWTYFTSREFVENNYNSKLVQHRANAGVMVQCMKKYAQHYRTNHVLFTLGNDFAF